MFNAEFFPTPDAVIERMLAPWLGEEPKWNERTRDYHAKRPALSTMSILEPSAGSGNILDWMKAHIESRERYSYGGDKTKRMYACERDPELKALLQGKSYKVIAADFLAYRGDHQFDLVVMNPPFSVGDQHVLHAYDVVAPGGHVVALVNSETLRNPYSETRQLLAKLIADRGDSEELGAVFQDAERKTDVQVTLIRLQKPTERDPLRFDFGKGPSRGKTPELTEDTFHDALAVRDVIGNMMQGYGLVKEAFVDYLRARRALKFYSKGLLASEYEDILKMADEAIGHDDEGRANLRVCYNEFSDSLKQCAWRQLLNKLNVQKLLTHDVRRNFETYGRHQGYMDFTHENVAALVDFLWGNKDHIMEKAVESVFDEFTKYYKENRCHVEGWKTNDRFKVNRKIILPRWVRFDDWRTARDLKTYGSEFRLNYSSEYDDIDKVMCYLTGESYERCFTIAQALTYQFRRTGTVRPGDAFTDTCESQFFNLRFFKKGTLHLVFKDERLWHEFNLRACAGKKWLPEHEEQAYRSRKYSPFEEPTNPVAPAFAPAQNRLPLGAGTQLSLLQAA